LVHPAIGLTAKYENGQEKSCGVRRET
jgi:hypothetical protein